MVKGETVLKKYTVTYSYDLEAETGNDAIDEFLRRMYEDENTTPDSDDFIAKEKKS